MILVAGGGRGGRARAAALAVLDDLGYRHLEASDAESALAVVESGEPIDLVFTDVVMPGKVRTRDFAQRVQSCAPTCRSCSPPATPKTPSSITAAWTRG